MTAPKDRPEIQFYDLSVDCGAHCQGGRAQLEPMSWPDEFSVVKYSDHLRHLKLAQIAVLEEVQPGLTEHDWVAAGLIDRKIKALRKELKG